jgi:DNA-binding MarR family transcriptional regulator/GNAT superfamily N-acetyltransferase
MDITASQDTVDEIRALSRTLVREWGFMGEQLAGTDLSPSSVHALIEIEPGGVTARDLGRLLHLEKSSVSRMLGKLVASGDVREEVGEKDGRLKLLALTDAGRQRVAAIHAFARAQVHGALGQLKTGEQDTVLQGLRLYTQALRSPVALAASDVQIVRGYRTGLIARVTEMHARYYARESGLGQHFESVVASGLAEFCHRVDTPANGLWAALQGDQIVGSVAMDGEDLGSNVAHLRWFIVGDGVRGGGVGRRLLSTALAFADERGFDETHLWTFSGLSAARHLYESMGFVLAEAWQGDQWGRQVMEQRFVRVRPRP